MPLSSRAFQALIVFLSLTATQLVAAQAQTPQPSSASQAETRDTAEQLAAQLESFTTDNFKPSSIVQLFTALTRDGKQLTVPANGLPFEGKKRRDFFAWLCQQYGVTAYAYVTGVPKKGVIGKATSGKKPPSPATFEDIEITGSSNSKDVFVSLSWGQGADGAPAYTRKSYRVEAAKARKDHIFAGIQRSSGPAKPIKNAEFEKVWESWKSNALWQDFQENTPQVAPEDLLRHSLELYSSGNFNDAITLGMDAASQFKAREGTQTANFAWALVAQALSQNRLGNATVAETLYRQAIEIFEKVEGPNASSLATALDNLASIYVANGRLAEAEPLRLRALQIFRAVLDPADPNIAATLQNLAVLYQSQNRIPEAERYFLEALAALEKVLGPNSQQVGITADNLAGFYRGQGQLDKAGEYYLKALTSFEKSVGSNHPDMALALQNYALLQQEQGQARSG